LNRLAFLLCATLAPALAQTKAEPAKAQKSLERAAQLEETGKLPEAFQVLTDAINADASLAAAWRERGKIRWMLGEAEYGAADLDRALATNPDDADAWLIRGDIRASMNRLE
jgi:serine/threonine-protein kinase